MKFILSLLIACLLLSCIKEVTLDIAPGEPIIIVNSIFESGKPPIVKLIRSTEIASKQLEDTISGARIKLFHSGQHVGDLFESSPGKYNSDFQSYNPNDSLSIRIESDLFPDLVATTIVPKEFEGVNFALDTVARMGYEDTPYYELEISLSDIIDDENYYDLEVWMKYDGDYFKTSFNTDDPAITRQSYYPPFPFISRYLVSAPFSDKTFNGQHKTMIFKIFPGRVQMTLNSFILPAVDILIQFKSTTEGQFLYNTSVLNHLQGRESDLIFGSGQPSDLIGNIQGGFGIFACEEVVQEGFHVESKEVIR